MTETGLRQRLLSEEIPGEREAERRAWALVRTELRQRERIPWPRRRARPLIALGIAVALLAAALTPPGRGLAERLREAVAEDAPEPITLPTSGRLLVLSADGPWIVQRDGSKRLLGAYEDATWSPRGLFVAATRDRTLVALEPNGRVRWTLTRPASISQPRWSPSGFRIAYRSGMALRVVAGDGTADRLLAPAPGPAPPAWRPVPEHVLAFVDARNVVGVVNTDAGREPSARFRAPATVQSLAWSADGKRLLALTNGARHLVYELGAGPPKSFASLRGHRILAAAFAPTETALATVEFDDAHGTSAIVLRPVRGRARTLFTGAGRFDGIAWSPDGRWLLVGWPDADQWLFLRVPDVRRVVTVSGVSAEFDPGGSGQGRFPRIISWCC
jgi:WD40-like Beta Propeller Repeat